MGGNGNVASFVELTLARDLCKMPIDANLRELWIGRIKRVIVRISMAIPPTRTLTAQYEPGQRTYQGRGEGGLDRILLYERELIGPTTIPFIIERALNEPLDKTRACAIFALHHLYEPYEPLLAKLKLLTGLPYSAGSANAMIRARRTKR